MNKLLRSVTTRMHLMHENENTLRVTPDHIETKIRVDADTWQYFENLDEDSRTMMAHVLKDYVERQK